MPRLPLRLPTRQFPPGPIDGSARSGGTRCPLFAAGRLATFRRPGLVQSHHTKVNRFGYAVKILRRSVTTRRRHSHRPGRRCQHRHPCDSRDRGNQTEWRESPRRGRTSRIAARSMIRLAAPGVIERAACEQPSTAAHLSCGGAVLASLSGRPSRAAEGGYGCPRVARRGTLVPARSLGSSSLLWWSWPG